MRKPYPIQPPQIWFSMILVRKDKQRADVNPKFQKELEGILKKHSQDRHIVLYTNETRLETINQEKKIRESQMTNPQRKTSRTHNPYNGGYFYIQTTTLEPKTLKVELLLEYKLEDSRQNY